ncbi:MAG: IclR family transcriptional regulator [Neomegalonema sp.]|nr:IclR family transcriptional regulator [Neomegalonema sp.]
MVRKSGAASSELTAREFGIPEEGGGKDRQFVTALARGLDILRAFRPGEISLGNQDLAERTGLPKPTVSRLTATLLELGYLTSHSRTGAYSLGPGVLALGFAMIASVDLRERARPLMEELASETECNVALGARDRLSVLYLDVARAEAAIALSMGVGSHLPLATTAMGRGILVAMPQEQRAFLIERMREEAKEDFTRIAEGIEQAVEDYQSRGLVLSAGDWREDVHAVAAPIVSPDGERLFSMNCGSASIRAPKQCLIEEMGPKLAQIAQQLSAPIAAYRGETLSL